MLLSCEQKADWEIISGNHDFLVFESILTPEVTNHGIRITRIADELNSMPKSVDDADVIIDVDNFGQREFEYDPLEGQYYLEENFTSLEAIDFEIQISLNDSLYTAKPELGKVSPLEVLRFQQVGETDSLRILGFDNPFSINQEAMFEIKVDYGPTFDEVYDAKYYFYVFNTLEINQILRPPKEATILPRGSRVVVQKYGLSPKYASYLRALLAETEWNGNFFFGASANPKGNVSGDALGFIAFSEVLRDTIIVE